MKKFSCAIDVLWEVLICIFLLFHLGIIIIQKVFVFQVRPSSNRYTIILLLPFDLLNWYAGWENRGKDRKNVRLCNNFAVSKSVSWSTSLFSELSRKCLRSSLYRYSFRQFRCSILECSRFHWRWLIFESVNTRFWIWHKICAFFLLRF